MKLIIKGRGCGKTTRLIHTSEVTGYPIAVASKTHARYVMDMAMGMGCKIPEPVTYKELTERGQHEVVGHKRVLADDIDVILHEALSAYLDCDVYCATMSVGE